MDRRDSQQRSNLAARQPVRRRAATYSTAIGLPGEPVAPTIGSGAKT